LVVVVERSVTAILAWSQWRRWHQAWAQYHHYRRRTADAPAPAPPPPTAHAPATLLDGVWERLEPLLPPTTRTGRPYAHDRRIILAAIIWLMETGCGWHALPDRFPPWQTVYSQFRQWQKLGIWDKIWSPGTQSVSEAELQL